MSCLHSCLPHGTILLPENKSPSIHSLLFGEPVTGGFTEGFTNRRRTKSSGSVASSPPSYGKPLNSPLKTQHEVFGKGIHFSLPESIFGGRSEPNHCQTIHQRRTSITTCEAAVVSSAMTGEKDTIGSSSSDMKDTTGESGPQDFNPTAAISGDYLLFQEAARRGNLVPVVRRVFSDHLTPVLAYRCLVREDDREAPSFLFESVEHGVVGSSVGRYSYVGAQPAMEVIAKEDLVTVLDHTTGTRVETLSDDPMKTPGDLSSEWKPVPVEGLPKAFCGGWVGYTSYDTVRYVEKRKLPFDKAPEDDRGLPDIHLGLYNDVVVFDHVNKVVFVICWVHLPKFDSVEEAYNNGKKRLKALVGRLQPCMAPQLLSGSVDLAVEQFGAREKDANMSKNDYKKAVEKAKEHILAGDIFQIVLSQRFERRTFSDPFEIYRALRIVNPSPYLTYLQTRGCILVASSPEILCRIAPERRVVNRPLAGTRRRGVTPEQDAALAADLLADEKECAEHVMLVDLGRNDVGKVSKAGTVRVEKLMDIERYSHVMHISSTVTGELLENLTCWDALRAALPVGTVSGAPKVRAMELIDELEPTRRGPYSGGMGYVSFTGEMDIALALRTMVFPTYAQYDTLYSYEDVKHRREWVVHIQAGAGIVADSNPESEYQECVNKAAGLERAIDLAEAAFLLPEEKNGNNNRGP